MTSSQGWPLLLVGGLLLLGYLANELGRRAHVPRVTLLLLLGALAGRSGLGLVPLSVSQHLPLVAETTLSMVGFLLGEQFLGKKLRRTGRSVLYVAAAQTMGASLFVLAATWMVGAPLPVTLLLAGIAPASAPAATIDVVREVRAKGPLTDTVLGVVAIDDAFGILAFSFFLALAQVASAGTLDGGVLAQAGWEVLGAAVLGVGLGLPMAWLTGRVRPGELTLMETLGFVLACGGLAEVIGVSYLLSCIVLGAVVANRAHHHSRPFHAIEGISQPFFVVFFVLAGLALDLEKLQAFGTVGLGYFVARTLGKLVVSPFAARAAGAPPTVRRYVGLCLLPQAGVALGLGLVAGDRFPGFASSLLSMLVGTTFLFELVGPLSTRLALSLAGEARAEN